MAEPIEAGTRDNKDKRNALMWNLRHALVEKAEQEEISPPGPTNGKNGSANGRSAGALPKRNTLRGRND